MTIASVLQGTGIVLSGVCWKNKTAGTKFRWAEIQDICVWIIGKSGSVIERYSWQERAEHNNTDFSQEDATYAEWKIRMQEDVTRKAMEENAKIEIVFWEIDENWTGGFRPYRGVVDALSFKKSLTKTLTP